MFKTVVGIPFESRNGISCPEKNAMWIIAAVSNYGHVILFYIRQTKLLASSVITKAATKRGKKNLLTYRRQL